MVYHSVCDHVNKSKKLHVYLCTLCTPSGPSADKGGRWGFPLKPQKTHFCKRNESFPNQVLFTLGWVGSTLAPTRTNLLNPTSGKDASHPCLINTWSKEDCTIVCVKGGSIGWLCSSQSRQYLIGERFVPLTLLIYLFLGVNFRNITVEFHLPYVLTMSNFIWIEYYLLFN